MIRYILVDDMPNILERIKAKIDTISKDYDLQYVKSYDSSKRAYEEINKEDFDLLIVDFEMPVFNGIELAQKIGNDKKIIFLTSTTNNEQQVINSLDISGYLSKPFDLDEFKTILKNKVVGKIQPTGSKKTNQYITLQIGVNKDVRFLPEQAYYITTSRNINGEQPDKNHVHIYGENDTILFKNVYVTISNLTKQLSAYNFKKINQSTIINFSHLKERDNTIISLFSSKETFEVAVKEKMKFVSMLRAKLKI